MVADGKEDPRLSGKKMEGGDALRTVECLRGRLLAERQASRVAREEAELLGKKLTALENTLREETQMMKKAEKKLKFLEKKLESSNISSMAVKPEHSSSSASSEASVGSSQNTSLAKNPENHEAKSSITESSISENPSENVSDSTKSNQGPENSSLDVKMKIPSAEPSTSCSISSRDNQSPQNPNNDDIHSSEISPVSDQSCSNLNISTAENQNEDEDPVDNSLALVPMTSPAVTLHTGEVKPVSESVREVLGALKHIREQLKSCLERRHCMIKVGQTQTLLCKQ